MLPSGVLSPHVTPVIGNGVVIDPGVLFEEIDGLERRGVSCERLLVSANAHLPRAWITRLRGLVRCSMAASTGVETAADVAAYLLAGADVVMSTSALLRHGPEYARVLLDGLGSWMERKGFMSVGGVRGVLARSAAGEPAYSRTGYLSAIEQATHTYAARGS